MSAGNLDIQINVEQGSIQEIEADTIILNLFEGVKEPGGGGGRGEFSGGAAVGRGDEGLA